jgi:organic radical activating enzyme
MSVNKTHIPYIEFYITNVCNLACAGCNRFNNYYFKGFQKWQDYAAIYQSWSQRLKFGSIAILGGEPMLNPDFLQWVDGITALWPNTHARIISNGFRLPYNKSLYQRLIGNKNLSLWVGIHNKQHKKTIIDNIKEFTVAPHTVVFNTENPYQQFLTITDKNGVKIIAEYNWWFHQGSIVVDNNQLSLHQSNVKKAHTICHMKTCHHFVRGKLYKCGVVAVLPEFEQQHKLNLSPADHKLLHSYKPLEITNSDQEVQTFVDNLKNPIDQCRFCPEQYNGNQIWSQLKNHV